MKLYNADKDGEQFKVLESPAYNYIFNYRTGTFIRWGKTMQENPQFSFYGPEILDIEISTICSKACSWCYKGNTAKGTYMSLGKFKRIFKRFPKVLTQIAFGIGDIDGNPDLWAIMEHCRENNIIPNITINGEGMQDIHYSNLVKYCGAVAVSHYGDDTCFNTVKELTDRGMNQVNIHKLLSEETLEECYKLIDSSKNDPKLEKLNAIVFLWLKPKGSRNKFSQINSAEKYKKLIEYAFEKEARIGFDSCSAANFTKAIKDREDFKKIEPMIESCESTLFSYYINVDGVGFPCSFTEGQPEFGGINMLKVDDFMKDVWVAEETRRFRTRLLKTIDCNGCRVCPAFNLEMKSESKIVLR